MNDPVDTVQIYMVEDTFTCDADPPCVPDGPPRLFGYFVVLDPTERAPGVYPVAPDNSADGVWIGALLTEWTGESCTPKLLLSAAADGEVEVLADEGGCVAVDVRGVTPTSYMGITMDPDGSALARECGA